ncbi:MAG: protein translocase subunit SecD [Deltaproteobacteria bacterium]|nr:protein translocase subunit SecD [Deltaproteobacteria bacterium]
MKTFKWRVILILAILVVACVYVFPSFGVPAWWPNLLPSEKIHLGLDLQGGMHLVLEVESDKAVESAMERISQELKTSLIKAKIRYRDLDRIEGDKIRLRILNPDQISSFEDVIEKSFGILEITSKDTSGDEPKFQLVLKGEEARYIKKMAVDQGLETIRNRIDQFGVSEPDIRPQGENRILIQLPGIKDPKRAVELIGKTALLEFKLVDDEHSLKDALKGIIPPDDEILTEVEVDPVTKQERRIPYLIKKRTYLTGEYLTDARVQIDSQYNEPYVSIEFDKKGARLFEQVTGANVKKRLAIVLDGHVYSAPVIQEKIAGGQARITGNFTTEEAHDLAIVLRAGALPAPVKILEERTVGPSLGRDSIESGIYSILIGGILVVLFILIYYKRAGLIANTALFLNIILIAAVLAAFRATLTLPGIAGIILTIGMAVDANVIIFERIREELRLGKTPRAAVDGGYSKAVLTILDANITTLIAALVLFQFGTGPVKGFAVTLSIGILASLFTALIVSRVIFDYFLLHRKVKQISI